MSVKLVAYYLPQFHPIPENDQWWGKGFTEWTNVTKAKPLFKGHYQPRLPADLGFYDLRIPEVREQQAAMASKYGVFGFCYYHYWFGNGKKLLERPISEILHSGKPDFPFMFCWANHKWSNIWIGNDSPDILMDQEYPGEQDYINHFMYLLPFFKDKRHIRIDGKIAFQIYKPHDIPDLDKFVAVFQDLAKQHGIGEIYIIGGNCNDDRARKLKLINGFTSNELGALRHNTQSRIIKNRKTFFGKVETKIRILFGRKSINELKRPVVINYKKAISNLINDRPREYDYFLTIVPDWDNSARAGKKSLILRGSTPSLWKEHLQTAVDITQKNNAPDKQIIFVKSWNEWAEGNYLEPDQKWGHSYLEAVRKVIK
jgi:hypothetical protein